MTESSAAAARFTEVDETLLLLSETRERAERAAKTIAESDSESPLVAALERVDRELLALHRGLMDEALFGSGPVAPAPVEQLALDAA